MITETEIPWTIVLARTLQDADRHRNPTLGQITIVTDEYTGRLQRISLRSGDRIVYVPGWRQGRFARQIMQDLRICQQ